MKTYTVYNTVTGKQWRIDAAKLDSILSSTKRHVTREMLHELDTIGLWRDSASLLPDYVITEDAVKG